VLVDSLDFSNLHFFKIIKIYRETNYWVGDKFCYSAKKNRRWGRTI